MSDKTKRVECPGGYVRYKLPNSIQRMKLMGKMGVSTQKEKLAKFMEQSELTALGLVMEHLKDCGLILEVKAEVEGQAITDWDVFIEVDQLADTVAEIGGEVLKHVFEKMTKKAEGEEAEAPAPGNEAQSS